MNTSRRNFLALTSGLGTLGLAACAPKQGGSGNEDHGGTGTQEPEVNLREFEDLKLDVDAWQYDKGNDCYYQLGLKYCTKPASTTYESLAIFVPGAYFDATAKGNRYSCSVKKDATVGTLSPVTAPAVMPINSVRLSAQACPESYSYEGLSRYLKAGLVYVYAGFRGRSSGYDSSSKAMIAGGSPWPVVGLKAAVRYLRYNAASLPIDPERIFVFGYGAGGGLSATMGAMGDSDLYAPYLDSIGAATHDAQGAALSDKIYGSASWCPITSFDTQDSAYEWMMGQFASTDTRASDAWTKLLSTDLATAYGDYVNGMDLRDDSDNALRLSAVDDGAYVDGSYYEYVMDTIESSAADFFSRTSFPYTYTPAQMGDPCFPGNPNLVRESEAAANEATTEEGTSGSTSITSGVSSVKSTVYDSASAYLSALNSNGRWITYSSNLGTVRISSLWDFVTRCRPASRSVAAFDMLDRSSSYNQLFGIGEESTLHFDQTVGGLLASKQASYAAAKGFDATLVTEWSDDLAKRDSMDNGMATRIAAMNPLYTLSGHYDGFGKSGVAAHWRINSGLFQTAAALTGELNLVLALRHYDGVADVSYETVWGRGFELAERQGDPQDNLVSWIVSCCPAVAKDGNTPKGDSGGDGDSPNDPS